MTRARGGGGVVGRLRSVTGGAFIAAAALLSAACGDDPPEPGEVRIVLSEDLGVGAAVVEIAGEGILGVRGPPGVQVVTGSVPVEGPKAFPRTRIVAIRETPGPLTLLVDVADRDAPLVAASWVQASGADDALIPPVLLPEIRVVR